MNEVLVSEKPKRDKESPHAYLFRLLNTSADDVAANREGRLSAQQREKIQKQFMRGFIVKSGILLFLVICFLFPLSRFGSSTLEIIVGLICAFFVGRMLFVFLRGFIRIHMALYHDIQAEQVHHVRGTPEFHIDKARAACTMQIQDQTFMIPRALSEIMQTTEEYDVYYLPQSKGLVSIEHIPHTPDSIS